MGYPVYVTKTEDNRKTPIVSLKQLNKNM